MSTVDRFGVCPLVTGLEWLLVTGLELWLLLTGLERVGTTAGSREVPGRKAL